MIKISIGMIVFASVFASVGQFLFKKSGSIFDRKTALGLFLYLIFIAMTLTAYKFGDVSVLFPLTNLSLIWNLFLAKKFLGESITLQKILATLIVLAGCFVVFL